MTIEVDASRVIRTLVAHPDHVAYVCWVTQESATSGERGFQGWSVVSFEARECDEPVELSGVRFVFDPYRTDELIGIQPRPAGQRADLVSKIRKVVPSADFSNPDWGVYEGDGFSIEFQMGGAEHCRSITLS